MRALYMLLFDQNLNLSGLRIQKKQFPMIPWKVTTDMQLYMIQLLYILKAMMIMHHVVIFIKEITKMFHSYIS